jgi:hypothetical protein
LKEGKKLRKFAEEQKDTINTGYLMAQEWFSGKYDKYFNMRFVKAHSGWRYRGSVHEWLKNTSFENDEDSPPVIRIPDDIILYQDRTKDDDKSGKRFFRDKELLLKDYKANPIDERTLFYLAQTCACLQQNDDSFYYYKLRSKREAFQEEKFHSLLRCGELSQKLGHEWEDVLPWFMKAIEHSEYRVEPYIHIATYYKTQKKYKIAYMFINTACQFQYPDHLILFVDKMAYTYTRWHLLGIIAYYVEKYQEGYVGCKKAIEMGLNVDMDTKNLEFYEKKFKEIKQTPQLSNNTNTILSNTLTKNVFVDKIIEELKQTNPKMTLKSIKKIANIKWKDRKNK